MQMKKSNEAKGTSLSDLGTLRNSLKSANFQELIKLKVIQSPLLVVHVPSQEHANCDSLPLRYGMHFETDSTITLSRITFTNKPQKNTDRISLDAYFLDSNNEEQFGHFIVGARRGYDNPVLVTVWRHDADTEEHLSDVMRSLREGDLLSPQALIELHPDYRSGKISKHADLVMILSKRMNAEQIKKMGEAVTASEQRTNAAIKERDRALEVAETLKGTVQQLSEVNAAQSSTIAEQRSTIQLNQMEIARLKREQQAAQRSDSQVTLSPPDLLVDVLERQIYRGSSCTILVMGDNTRRHMKTSTFDPNGSVTSYAISLKGKRVRISCWDPINQPGKWSSQGYFRNVYAVE
jgi:hypothetical protein